MLKKLAISTSVALFGFALISLMAWSPVRAAFAPYLGAVGIYSTFDASTNDNAARADLTSAYNSITSQPCTATLDPINMSNAILQPGVYCFINGPINLTGTLQLSSYSDPNGIFIFKFSDAMNVQSFFTVAPMNNARPENIYWQTPGTAFVDYGTSFKGNILASGNITLKQGASVGGRVLSLNGYVTAPAGSVYCASCQRDGANGQSGTFVSGPLACSPSSQTTILGAPVTFTATGGNGQYAWFAPGLRLINPYGSAFRADYAIPGTYTITVTSNNQTANCSLTVNAGSVLGASTDLPGMPNTGGGGEYLIYSLWGVISALSPFAIGSRRQS